MQIAHVTHTDEEIDLRKGSSVLGPSATLQRCRVQLPTSARSLTLSGATLVDCTIEAARPFTNFQGWCRTNLRGCTFKGRYVGNDFGRWPELAGDLGAVSGCDFTQAMLDGCRFMNVAPSEVRLPGWPFFVLEDPVGRLQELRSRRWPGKLDAWVEIFDFAPRDVSFAVFDATTLAPKFGATADDLRDALAAK